MIKIKGYNDNATRAAQFLKDVKARNWGDASHNVFSMSIVGEINRMLARNPINYTYYISPEMFVHPEIFLAFSQPIDFQKILHSNPEAKLILFGEEHIKNVAALPFLASQVPFLRNAGFNCFGFEALSISERRLVVDFEKGVAGAEPRLAERLKCSSGFLKYSVERYVALMGAARKERLKIGMLTHPDELRPLNEQLGPGLGLQFRNCFMCLAINSYLAGGGKMLGLVGADHVEIRSAMPAILKKEFEMDCISVLLIEDKLINEPFMVQCSREVEQIIPALRSATGQTSPYDSFPKAADWIIVLPDQGQKWGI
jgi:hypothetical protein